MAEAALEGDLGDWHGALQKGARPCYAGLDNILVRRLSGRTFELPGEVNGAETDFGGKVVDAQRLVHPFLDQLADGFQLMVIQSCDPWQGCLTPGRMVADELRRQKARDAIREEVSLPIDQHPTYHPPKLFDQRIVFAQPGQKFETFRVTVTQFHCGGVEKFALDVEMQRFERGEQPDAEIATARQYEHPASGHTGTGMFAAKFTFDLHRTAQVKNYEMVVATRKMCPVRLFLLPGGIKGRPAEAVAGLIYSMFRTQQYTVRIRRR
jgi:hypothetical protein